MTFFPSFTCCFLSDRKSEIHLQVQLKELVLQQMMLLKAELQSTNRILAQAPEESGTVGLNECHLQTYRLCRQLQGDGEGFEA